jgi:hypothetical protein
MTNINKHRWTCLVIFLTSAPLAYARGNTNGLTLLFIIGGLVIAIPILWYFSQLILALPFLIIHWFDKTLSEKQIGCVFGLFVFTLFVPIILLRDFVDSLNYPVLVYLLLAILWFYAIYLIVKAIQLILNKYDERDKSPNDRAE